MQFLNQVNFTLVSGVKDSVRGRGAVLIAQPGGREAGVLGGVVDGDRHLVDGREAERIVGGSEHPQPRRPILAPHIGGEFRR
jgi:hypothetical protein